MIRTLAALAALLAVVAWGCRSASTSPSSPTSLAADTAVEATPTVEAGGCSPARPHAAGNFDQTIASSGLRRTYILHVPAGYDGGRPAPLLLSFHGYGLSAKFFAPYVNFDAIADQAGFVLVTPDGTGDPQQWNAAGYAGGSADVQFVRDLLAKLNGDLCIDARAVYAAGFSNGGGMAMRAACELPDVFAAVGVVAATYVNCRADVPLIAFHGSSDPLAPYEGSTDPSADIFAPVRRSVSEWARELGCDALAVISRPSSEVELSTFQRCPLGDGEVLLYTILGGGHTWPGTTPLAPQLFGMTTQQIDASRVMWDFFAARRRPG